MRFLSSAVSPDHDSAMMTSSGVIMPRSPRLASAAWTKKAGVPVEAKEAAIFLPMWPDLPRPVTIRRPLALRIRSTAAVNGAPRSASRAAASAAMPLASASRVRRADAIAGDVEGVTEVAARGFEMAIKRSRASFQRRGRPGRQAGRPLPRHRFQCDALGPLASLTPSLTILVLTLLTAFAGAGRAYLVA